MLTSLQDFLIETVNKTIMMVVVGTLCILMSPSFNLILLSANKVVERYCFYTCLSFCSQRGGVHPLGRHNPLADIPPGQTPPQADTPGQTYTPKTATVADGTHPTGMHSCTVIII